MACSRSPTTTTTSCNSCGRTGGSIASRRARTTRAERWCSCAGTAPPCASPRDAASQDSTQRVRRKAPRRSCRPPGPPPLTDAGSFHRELPLPGFLMPAAGRADVRCRRAQRRVGIALRRGPPLNSGCASVGAAVAPSSFIASGTCELTFFLLIVDLLSVETLATKRASGLPTAAYCATLRWHVRAHLPP